MLGPFFFAKSCEKLNVCCAKCPRMMICSKPIERFLLRTIAFKSLHNLDVSGITVLTSVHLAYVPILRNCVGTLCKGASSRIAVT